MIILVLAIIIRIIANPISNVFQKQLTNKHHPLFVNLVCYGILSLVSIFLVFDFPYKTIPPAFWYYAVIGGLFGALGNGFIIKALQKGELSVLGPINAYKSIVGILFAFLLIGELPTAWSFLGVGLIIIGSYFVLDNGPEKFTWSIFKQPAIQYRIAALIFTGIQAVTDKQVILHSNLTYAFAGWCIFGFLFSIPLFFTSKIDLKQQVAHFTNKITLIYTGLCLSVATMVVCTNYVFNNMQVGTALALFQISILLTVLFGHHFFNEKGFVKKIAGSIIMIAGSLLILLLK
jgi:drug/metabolite transporter (DMT)-like permease